MAVEAALFEPKPFGRYVLLDKLAVGGMAEIYKAKTYGVDGFEKLLAIKRILPHCAADKEFISMLIDEAKLTVLLSHANIVQVYDLGKVGEDYFISMEYISGTNLREVIHRLSQKGEKVTEEIAVYVASEICKGLDYAHRKTDSQGNPLNIVHRDVSPQNILISYEGEVKIVDFGIAKAAMNVSHTMAGILKGKIAYMSPEQALGKPLDHRTDIFSAGVVLYEMLTGEKLFSGETQFEVLNQIRTTRVNTMMLPAHIPGPLKGILAKALAYNSKDRYQSVGDFQLDLTKFLYSSYIDFSPRQLANLVSRLFEREMKRHEAIPPIDERTRSVMVAQAGKENIVVHGTAPPTGAITQKTAVSGVHVLPAMRRMTRPLVAAGILLAALIGGYLGYRTFLTEPREEAVKPLPPVSEPAIDTGTFQVSSSPQGARILLNNRDTGLLTPARLERLSLGQDYEIRLQKEKYREATRSIALTSTEPILISETLAPLPLGMIEIGSAPAGAKILVDNKETGLVTPNRIENLEIPKTYQIRLSLPGHSDWSGSVEVRDLEPVKLAAVLTHLPTPPPQPLPPPKEKEAAKPVPKPAPVKPVKPEPKPERVVEEPSVGGAARLQVDSDPSGADVYVNSEFKGTTPVTISDLAAETVKVLIAKEGYLKYSGNVTLRAGENRNLGMIRLGGLYGEVSFNSIPPRANIYFDGELIAPKTPVTIRKVPRDRTHTIKLQLDGYRAWETSFDLRDSESKKYNVTLEKD